MSLTKIMPINIGLRSSRIWSVFLLLRLPVCALISHLLARLNVLTFIRDFFSIFIHTDTHLHTCIGARQCQEKMNCTMSSTCRLFVKKEWIWRKKCEDKECVCVCVQRYERFCTSTSRWLVRRNTQVGSERRICISDHSERIKNVQKVSKLTYSCG